MIKNEYKASKYAAKVHEISDTLENLMLEMTHELRESEQRYRSIIEFAADAIITIDPNRRVTSWNKGATSVFGYSEDEALGMTIEELVAQDKVHREALSLSEEVLRGKNINSLEAVRYTKTGEPRYVLISASPIMNEAGEVEAVSLMYKDITDLKQAHEQLLRTEKQATLGTIAGSIGHELNNLVGGLMIHARLLQQQYDKPERVKEIADIFSTNLEKVALHGKNLLSLSRPTRPRFEPIDLNSVLLETTETLNLTGVLKHLKIEKNFSANGQYVYGDRNLLEQMIRNIEINSAHAMKPGGTLKLETKATADNKYFEMKITDSGSGIPPELMEKIFLPFFTTKTEGQGTGLGLPIVKDIVEQHGGTIALSSEQGQGTTVCIRIPIAQDISFTSQIKLE
jgi:two-component system, NtrC family, sensor kinase